VPLQQGRILQPRQRSSDPVHAAASVSARLTAVAIRSRRYSGVAWMSPTGLTDAQASRAIDSITSGDVSANGSRDRTCRRRPIAPR
jgi:hypothetical protein